MNVAQNTVAAFLVESLPEDWLSLKTLVLRESIMLCVYLNTNAFPNKKIPLFYRVCWIFHAHCHYCYQRQLLQIWSKFIIQEF